VLPMNVQKLKTSMTMFGLRFVAALLLLSMISLASAQEPGQQTETDYALSAGLEKYFDRRSVKSSIRTVLGVGTVEAIDSHRESKIQYRGTRTNWESDPGSCSDVVEVRPARKPIDELIRLESENPAVDEPTIRQANFIAWVDRKDRINMLIDQPMGKYEYSTVCEVAPDWEASPASNVYPHYPEADLNKVVRITATAPGGLEEVFQGLQALGVFGEYEINE
jgi:hypothetical protein